MNVLLGARVFVPIMFLVQFLFFSLCFLSLRIACSTGSGYSFPLCGLFHCGPAIAKRKNAFSQLHVLNRSKPVPEGVHVAGEVAICLSCAPCNSPSSWLGSRDSSDSIFPICSGCLVSIRSFHSARGFILARQKLSDIFRTEAKK